jgi:hypothetical protein
MTALEVMVNRSSAVAPRAGAAPGTVSIPSAPPPAVVYPFNARGPASPAPAGARVEWPRKPLGRRCG